MSIASMKSLLKKAEEGNYAVGFHNVIDSVSLTGILNAAQEKHAPIMVGIAQVQCEKFVDFDSIMNLLVHECEKASVPVGIHLDHGLDIEMIRKAIDLGCSSVMIDASGYSLAQNIKITQKVVELAHANGVSVEAEFGQMNDEISEEAQETCFTDVEGAIKFVQATDIDALAVSFGSVHGIHDTVPALNLTLLEHLHKDIPVPLVMHGGSGHDRRTYHQVIDRGIRKINYVSYGYQRVAAKVREYLMNNPYTVYDNISYLAIDAFKEVFGEVVTSFRSEGKA
ncbi:MAG: class II fructose-bisphosphate aldolase [Sphaerochaetaceae bacterium]|nr:class II fructose-bisphosphate aldolase [Sphaerochaetaceae bacterium]